MTQVLTSSDYTKRLKVKKETQMPMLTNNSNQQHTSGIQNEKSNRLACLMILLKH